MKRFVSLLLILLFILSSALSGCDQDEKSVQNSSSQNNPTVTPDDRKDPNDDRKAPDDRKELKVTKAPDEKIINVLSYDDELPIAIEKFKELHPDFGYKIKVTDTSLVCSSHEVILDQALAAGNPDVPDIYSVESPYAVKYTQGEACQYAAAYKDLGIDVDNLLKAASIAKYSIDLGTNPEGELVSLCYLSTTGAFIYRRSIAKKVWGTDDPSAIKEIAGPGWDKFFEAAADLKKKGYVICSSADDIWQATARSADQAWVVGGKLVIDPKHEEFMDLAKKLRKKGYVNNTREWTDEWYNDMKDGGRKKAFGFFGPTWFLNYRLLPNCGGKTIGKGTYGDWAVCESPTSFYWGGTWVLANKDSKVKDGVGEIIKWITLDTSETGFQYLRANGKLGSGVKDAVPSAVVMRMSDAKIDFLGGQNLFDAFISAGDDTNGKNATKYDDTIDFYWLNQVHEYTDGKKSREKAIADFKKQVADNLDVIVE